MRLIHSFWSKPCFENRWGIEGTYEMNIWLYALSCIYAKKSGSHINLHCDKTSYKYFKHLPYDNIYVDTDCLDNIKSRSTIFWAASKHIALEKEPLGSIHIDGDVFIKSKKCLEFLNFDKYDVICQNIENAHYPDKHHFRYIFPDYIISQQEAYNVGVLGFNSQELKEKYLNNYKYWLNTINFHHQEACADLILEQVYIKYLSQNYNVRLLFDSKKMKEQAKLVDYAHLLGQEKYKRINSIISVVKQLNPTLYNKLVQEGLKCRF